MDARKEVLRWQEIRKWRNVLFQAKVASIALFTGGDITTSASRIISEETTAKVQGLYFQWVTWLRVSLSNAIPVIQNMYRVIPSPDWPEIEPDKAILK